MSESRVLPLLEYKFQEQERIVVRYKDYPPQILSAENYNQFFGVTLSHGVFYDTCYEKEMLALLDKYSNLTYRYKEENRQLKKFLDQPKNYFSICYVNEVCGYALVANEDIPADTVVGTYSGLLAIELADLKQLLPLSERAYDMGLGGLSRVELDGISYSLTLRAKKYSDLTRFAIHLPTQSELNELEQGGLLGAIKSKAVLTENITYPMANCNGVPVRYYQTTKAIKKGELAGISYGVGYWKNRGRPCLLVREGDSDDFRIAYFDKDANRYFLSREVVVTQEKEKIEKPVSCSSLPTITKPSFFMQPKTEPKPLRREERLSSAQATYGSFYARNMKPVIPHSQLPTRSSVLRSQQDFNLPIKKDDSSYACSLRKKFKI